MTTLELTGLFGIIANITSNIAFIPQIIKSYQRKSVEDISIGMFCILFFTQVCWIIYAIPLHATQLLVSCALEIVLLSPIFVMWWKYSRPQPHHTGFADAPLEVVSDA